MKIEKHKIARLVIQQPLYDENGNFKKRFVLKGINDFLTKTHGKNHFEFLVMAGGVLQGFWPSELGANLSIDSLEGKHLYKFFSAGNGAISNFFENILKDYYKKLSDVTDYFTIGIDIRNPKSKQLIELVLVADLKKSKVIRWTGKFYPAGSQKNNLVKINDLKTHFIRLNNQNVVILGCHDLMVYSPRGQAMVTPDSWKGEVSADFRRQCSKFKPDIVLQHPHETDSPNIWNLAWKTLEKELPSVKHYVSGIYFPKDEEPRSTLEKVLEQTKKGDVLDIVLM